MNDAELKATIRECLDGKRESFNRIVKAFQNPIFHFSYQFTRNADEAGDATMEIFLKAYRGIDSFKPRYRFSNWLYKIAFNHLVQTSRRQKMEKRVMDSELAFRSDTVQAETPESVFLRGEKREEVKKGLHAIQPKHRTALMLRYHHQLSYKQISLIMGIPRNTVASLIMRGKKELRSKFGRQET